MTPSVKNNNKLLPLIKRDENTSINFARMSMLEKTRNSEIQNSGHMK